MLNFNNTRILFIGLLAITIAIHVAYGLPWYVYLLLLFIYSLVLFYGCYYVGSNFFIPIVCSAKTDKKVVAITFDDGPDAANTPQILQLLKDNNIQAAFFCIGRNIAGNEALLKDIDTDGHLIGNHSFSHHFWFDMFSAQKMQTDLQMMDEATQNVIGKAPKLFRPPYGVTNPNLKKAIVKGNYIPIGWNVRSLDTVIKDEEKLFKKVTNKLKPGAVFLFHDTSNTTLAILPAFLKHVKSSGYEVVRLDKMINLQAYV
jgi:peptidoglycan-N-acetylglucosamine deacetylase